MARHRKTEAPEPKARELGGSAEERNRHLRYAHEQYSASGQGSFGAPKGRKLPLQKPPANKADYPPNTACRGRPTRRSKPTASRKNSPQATTGAADCS